MLYSYCAEYILSMSLYWQENSTSCGSGLDWGWRWCRHGHGLLLCADSHIM